MKNTLMPGPFYGTPTTRIVVPDTAVAAGASNSSIATFQLPANCLVVARVMAKDTDLARALYVITASFFNDSARKVKATGTLTGTDVFANGETITIGAKTYTMQTTLTNVDGNVLIGASLSASLDNLKAAINLSTGAGTTYATAMTAHPTVAATTKTATALTVEALLYGTGGNSIASTETCSNASFGAATLAGGVDACNRIGSPDVIALEEDSGWAATLAVNGGTAGENGYGELKVTADSANVTTFSAVIEVYDV